MSQLEEIKARAEGHTEGPWEVVRGEWGTSNKRLTMLWAGQRDENEFMVATAFAESKADAELIAVAPKLIAALEAVETLAENFATADSALYDDGFNKGHCAGRRTAASLIHKTIKEALR